MDVTTAQRTRVTVADANGNQAANTFFYADPLDDRGAPSQLPGGMRHIVPRIRVLVGRCTGQRVLALEQEQGITPRGCAVRVRRGFDGELLRQLVAALEVR